MYFVVVVVVVVVVKEDPVKTLQLTSAFTIYLM